MVRVGGPNPQETRPLYDILSVAGLIDEVDFTWNADGSLATQVFKKGGATVLTLTYTWNPDGTLNRIVRT